MGDRQECCVPKTCLRITGRVKAVKAISGHSNGLSAIRRTHLRRMTSRLMWSGASIATALSLAACSGIIPKDGPEATAFVANATVVANPEQAVRYVLVGLSPDTLKIANRVPEASDPVFTSFARRSQPSQARIAVGDILQVTVFEATTGGLFLPAEAGSRNGNFVTIPNQQVDSSGTLVTPYAGSLKVVGKTPQGVGREIASHLSNRAIEPQVVVTVVERRSNEVSVLGDVNQPVRFALDPGGARVLDALARAGGPKNAAFESIIVLQRGGQTQRARLSKTIKNPVQNVELQAGDMVYVDHSPKSFMTLGATVAPGAVGGINNRRFTFDTETESLSEAIAKSGGLDDSRANPKALFLYRAESRQALVEMGVDVSAFQGPLVPTIYSVDISRPDGYLITSGFLMKDRDFIFVSNALTPDLNKLLNTIENVALATYNFTNSASTAGLIVR